MKKVAIVSGDFPPSSLPSAQRMRFLAPYLAEYGWEPIIVTADPSFYESRIDPENVCLISKPLEIIRTPAIPAPWTRKVRFGDVGVRTLWFFWKALCDLCLNRDIDLILITVPPNISMILGRFIYEKFGIPYIIDYQDPWVTEYYWQLPKEKRPPKWFWSYWLSRMLEPLALKHVSHIVGVSEATATSIISRYSWLNGKDHSEIPLGAEHGDFAYVKVHPRKNSFFQKEDGLIHIAYVGAYLPAMRATAEALFKAVCLGIDRAPELFNRLRFYFIGSNYAPNLSEDYHARPLAVKMGIGHLVVEHPPRVPYLDSLQVLLDADILLALGSSEIHYTASKIFPCILAQKPLLGIFHEESTVVRILKETAGGEVVAFNSNVKPEDKVEEILSVLQKMALNYQSYRPLTRWDVFEDYSTRTMSGRLAAVLDQVMAKRQSTGKK